MERPPKPELEYDERIDSSGTLVRQLTAESEALWARYLRQDRLARIAIWKADNEKEDI